MDKIKTRVQSSRGSLGPVAAFKNIIASEGFVRLFFYGICSISLELLGIKRTLVDWSLSRIACCPSWNHPREDLEAYWSMSSS